MAPRRRSVVWFVAGAVAGVALPLLGWGLMAGKPTAARAVADATVPGFVPKPSYERILRENNEAVTSGEAMVKGPLQSASGPLVLVGLYTERARLTGNYDDYGRAEDLVARI